MSTSWAGRGDEWRGRPVLVPAICLPYDSQVVMSGINGTHLSQDPDGLSLRDALRVVARWKWLIIGLTLGLAAVAFGYSYAQPKQYTSFTDLKYEQQVNISNPLGPSYVSPLTIEQELQGVGSALAAPAIKEQVAQAVGLPASDPQISASAALITNTSVVRISTKAKTASRAAAIATAFADAFIASSKADVQRQLLQAEQVVQTELNSMKKTPASQQTTDYILLAQRLQDLKIAEQTATGNYRVIAPAVAPTGPSSPRPKRDAALGLAAGLLIGIALAFLLEQLDTRVRTRREVADALGLPVVGRVARVDRSSLEAAPLAVLAEPDGLAAESLRKLRNNLDYLNVDGSLSTVLFTSCVRGEGKSITVANLAITLAMGGKRVVVVDGDLRRPRMHRYFDLPNETGLSDVIAGKVDVTDALQRFALPGQAWSSTNGGNGSKPAESASDPQAPRLGVLTSGPLPPNPAELIGSARFGEVLDKLQTAADIVLIDAPAFMPVSDAAAMAPKVDGAFILVSMEDVTRPMLTEAREYLDQLPCRKLGLIITREHIGKADHYRYHYYDRDELAKV